MSGLKKIEFTITDTGEKAEFYIIEQTRINNINYLLVADSDEEESEAYILKETYEEEDAFDAVYEIVEDDDELDAVSEVFARLIEDMDIALE